jgi:fructose/tagatose bisphosphate aldolase
MEPVVAAMRDRNTAALIEVARLEWGKFKSGSMKAVKETYDKYGDSKFTRLHLDHIPVIDEDNKIVDYLAIIKEAIVLGFESVMVDGSRLPLAENIAATRAVADIAHAAGVPVEAELGAVTGHESGPAVDYEVLFVSRKGFTCVDEAKRFVRESGADWLSVAFGNIHGAISIARRAEKKVTARLDIEHLKSLVAATDLPLVLHGGSGIDPVCIRQAVAAGICKINIGSTIRQAYEQGITVSEIQARQNVYDSCCDLIDNELQIRNSADVIMHA